MKRLSWNSAVPAPFESGWSIFLKLLAINHMNVGELLPLIQKRRGYPTPTQALDFSRSDWIDFERFARLVGVQPERLKQGFLDQIGFDARRPQERYAV